MWLYRNMSLTPCIIYMYIGTLLYHEHCVKHDCARSLAAATMLATNQLISHRLINSYNKIFGNDVLHRLIHVKCFFFPNFLN